MLANRLKVGDTIGIISPSAPITKELMEQFQEGLKVFENLGFKVKLSKNVYANTFGYSATINEKVEDIHEMFSNKDVKAIICSQGGQNSNAILPFLDYELIKNNPKIILGISDSTALLNAIYAKTGMITYHQNDVIWGLGREVSQKEMNDFMMRLMDGKIGEIEHFTKWRSLKEGQTEGYLVGGNLSTFTKLLNSKFCPDFENKILFLEEYAEKSPLDEVDSRINLLKQNKVFDKINGLWIGYYESDTENAKFEDVVMNNLKEYHFPLLKCNDFGHNCENVVIPIGAKVKLDATNCEVQILEKIVDKII